MNTEQIKQNILSKLKKTSTGWSAPDPDEEEFEGLGTQLTSAFSPGEGAGALEYLHDLPHDKKPTGELESFLADLGFTADVEELSEQDCASILYDIFYAGKTDKQAFIPADQMEDLVLKAGNWEKSAIGDQSLTDDDVAKMPENLRQIYLSIFETDDSDPADDMELDEATGGPKRTSKQGDKKKKTVATDPNDPEYWVGKQITFDEDSIQGDADDWDEYGEGYYDSIVEHFGEKATITSVEVDTDGEAGHAYYSLKFKDGFEIENTNFFEIPKEMVAAGVPDDGGY